METKEFRIGNSIRVIYSFTISYSLFQYEANSNEIYFSGFRVQSNIQQLIIHNVKDHRIDSLDIIKNKSFLDLEGNIPIKDTNLCISSQNNLQCTKISTLPLSM